VKETLDFIIIGAQKAGTSSLFHYLRHHPEVAVPAGKEAPFFSHDFEYARGFAAYMNDLQGEIAHPDPSSKWGTVTPHYTAGNVWYADTEARRSYDERTVPLRIRDQLPNVRLIAILRDPVERAVSGHRELVMLGFDRRSFDTAVDDLLHEDALERARTCPELATSYVVWGEYGRILKGYFDVFPHEQLLVVFTDELHAAPARLLGRIQDFIGVKGDYLPDNLGERYNAGIDVRQFSWTRPSSWMSPYSPLSPQGLQLALRRNAAARTVWRMVPYARRRGLKDRYNRLARRIVLSNAERSADEVGSETLARLREHYAADTLQLSALLGRTPPWTSGGVAESIAGPSGPVSNSDT
jgi:hypothetical protein